MLGYFHMRLFILALCLAASQMEGAWVRVGDNWSDARYTPTMKVQEHFDLGATYAQEEKWEEALTQFKIILHHFKDSPFYAESIYQVGLCYYFLGHYDFANTYFSHYLNSGGTLKHFEQVFDFKYQIGLSFAEGKKKHLLGKENLPRLQPAKGDAFEIFNEVIASLPSQEIAAKSLTAKADLLRDKKEFKDSIETLQVLIKRFPKHSLAADAYITVGEIYLQQLKHDPQNTDLIALGELNNQKFKKTFPGDERVSKLEAIMTSMSEVHANSLYEVGRFYERSKRPKAASIYYKDTIKRFPESEAAEKSKVRLKTLSL